MILFILASQASQVFYLDDPKLRNQWRVVQKYSPRNIYDVIPQAEGQDEKKMTLLPKKHTKRVNPP